jgi:hypothetical protein
VIPLAELPTTAGVYVLHLSEPLAHARGYTGWAADIARRVAEHLDVEACRQAGFHLNAEPDARRSFLQEVYQLAHDLRPGAPWEPLSAASPAF